MGNILGQEFLKELEAEIPASRKCIERVPPSVFDSKPHEKSMQMGYLTLLVAEMPKWIEAAIEIGEIDLALWEKYKLTTTEDLVKHFDECIAGAKKALQNTTDEAMEKMFCLKMNGAEIMKSSIKETIGSTINHWVHHRGQLTVYMRLNDIPVPSIYGPSADDKAF